MQCLPWSRSANFHNCGFGYIERISPSARKQPNGLSYKYTRNLQDFTYAIYMYILCVFSLFSFCFVLVFIADVCIVWTQIPKQNKKNSSWKLFVKSRLAMIMRTHNVYYIDRNCTSYMCMCVCVCGVERPVKSLKTLWMNMVDHIHTVTDDDDCRSILYRKRDRHICSRLLDYLLLLLVFLLLLNCLNHFAFTHRTCQQNIL